MSGEKRSEGAAPVETPGPPAFRSASEAHVLFVDPGLDDVGWAVFRGRRTRATINEVLRSFVASGTISTDPTERLAYRLVRIAHSIQATARVHHIESAWVEVSPYPGQHASRGRKARQSVNRLYMATGAILAAPEGVGADTQVVNALTTPKEQRHAILLAAMEKEGIDIPRGPRGGAREDEWDAIWLGVQVLTT